MSKSQAVTFGHKGFWAYDVFAGVFLKHLIDAAQESTEANADWPAKAVSNWRVWAVLGGDLGLPLDEHWTLEQQATFIALAEHACTTLATRELISQEEIVSWPFVDDLRIDTRGDQVVPTAPIVELGRAIIALIRDELPEAPKGEAWFFGSETRTVRMDASWDGRWNAHRRR